MLHYWQVQVVQEVQGVQQCSKLSRWKNKNKHFLACLHHESCLLVYFIIYNGVAVLVIQKYCTWAISRGWRRRSWRPRWSRWSDWSWSTITWDTWWTWYPRGAWWTHHRLSFRSLKWKTLTIACFLTTMTRYIRGNSPQVLVSQGYLVSLKTLPPPCLPSLLWYPGHLSPPVMTHTLYDWSSDHMLKIWRRRNLPSLPGEPTYQELWKERSSVKVTH